MPLQTVRPKHSATTPWPAKAASSCSSSEPGARASSGDDLGGRIDRELILLGARLAEHHRIDDLEMRRLAVSAGGPGCRTHGPDEAPR